MKAIAIGFTILFLGMAIDAQEKNETKNSLAPFLSYQQFQALTAAEQRSYIKDVKEFVRNLAKNNRYFVENLESQESATRAPAADRVCMGGKTDFNGTSAQELRSILEADIRSCTSLVEKIVAADSAVGKAMPKNGVWDKTAVDKYLAAGNFKPGEHRGNYLPSAVPVLLGLKERVLDGQKNANSPKDQEQWGGLVIQLNGVLSQFDTRRPPDDNYNKAAMDKAIAEVKAVYSTLDDEGRRVKKLSKSASLTHPGVAWPHRPARPDSQALPPKPAPPKLSSQCFSSGFVVAREANGVCPPVRELPAEVRWADHEKIGMFKCAGKTEVMCNPVLFGYTSTCRDFVENNFWRYLNDCQWKPFCVASAGNTTETCFKLSSEPIVEGSVQTVWSSTVKNKDSKTIYEAYIKSIQELCQEGQNVDTNRGDINTESCKEETEKINKRIKQKYNPDGDGAAATGAAASGAQ